MNVEDVEDEYKRRLEN
ncbi:hypothetical protein AWZ03_015362, partial [Drosophila navojoa]